MARPKSQKRVVRLSVTLDESDHTTVKRIASQLDVSTAWVIRRAVTGFIEQYSEEAPPEMPPRHRKINAT